MPMSDLIRMHAYREMLAALDMPRVLSVRFKYAADIRLPLGSP